MTAQLPAFIPSGTTWEYYAVKFHTYASWEARLLATEIYAQYDRDLGFAEVSKTRFIEVINEALGKPDFFSEGHWIAALAGVMQTGYWRIDVAEGDGTFLVYPSDLELQRFRAFETAANRAFVEATAVARRTFFKELPTASLDHYTKAEYAHPTAAEATDEGMIAFVAKTHTYGSHALRSFAITVAEHYDPKLGYANISAGRLANILGLTLSEVVEMTSELEGSGLWRVVSEKGTPTRYYLSDMERLNLQKYLMYTLGGVPFSDDDIVRVLPAPIDYHAQSDMEGETAW